MFGMEKNIQVKTNISGCKYQLLPAGLGVVVGAEEAGGERKSGSKQKRTTIKTAKYDVIKCMCLYKNEGDKGVKLCIASQLFLALPQAL